MRRAEAEFGDEADCGLAWALHLAGEWLQCSPFPLVEEGCV